MKLMENKKLGQLIGQIGKGQVKLREQIQLALIHAIGHAIVTRDTTFGKRLMDATNGAIRRQGIVNYLGEFGPFTWDAKNEVFKLTKGWEACKPEEVEKYLDKLEAGPKWWEHTKEAKLQPYDPLKDFQSLLKRVTNHIEKAKEEKRVIPNSDVFDYLQSAMEDYKLDHSKVAADEKEKQQSQDPQDLMAANASRELRAAY